MKADICFSAALAFSFLDVDLDLIFSPKSECLGVTTLAEAEFPSTGVTFGVEGITEEGWIFGEGGVCCDPFEEVDVFRLALLLLLPLPCCVEAKKWSVEMSGLNSAEEEPVVFLEAIETDVTAPLETDATPTDGFFAIGGFSAVTSEEARRDRKLEDNADIAEVDAAAGDIVAAEDATTAADG